MMRIALLLLSLSLSTVTFAADSPAQQQWKAFLAGPSASTYALLSETIRKCVVVKCHDEDVAGSENNFTNFYKLLSLAEHGNHLAMEVAFQIRPLYEMAAAPSESLDKSLGLSATLEPTFFFELVQKYDVSTSLLEDLVLQTSLESVDSLSAQRKEWRRRIESFSKVKDARLVPLRDKAVAFIQNVLDKYSSLPDDALGK